MWRSNLDEMVKGNKRTFQFLYNNSIYLPIMALNSLFYQLQHITKFYSTSSQILRKKKLQKIFPVQQGHKVSLLMHGGPFLQKDFHDR